MSSVLGPMNSMLPRHSVLKKLHAPVAHLSLLYLSSWVLYTEALHDDDAKGRGEGELHQPGSIKFACCQA